VADHALDPIAHAQSFLAVADLASGLISAGTIGLVPRAFKDRRRWRSVDSLWWLLGQIDERFVVGPIRRFARQNHLVSDSRSRTMDVRRGGPMSLRGFRRGWPAGLCEEDKERSLP
jgi:hypothetical protein